MVAIRGGYRKTRGWYLTKLSLSSALLLNFSDMCFVLCSFLFVVFFCFVFVLFRLPCSRWSFVGVPLINSCPTDHVPDGQPRILLGTVEARSVIVKNTTTEDLDTFRVLLKQQPEGVVHSLARSVVQVIQMLFVTCRVRLVVLVSWVRHSGYMRDGLRWGRAIYSCLYSWCPHIIFITVIPGST